VAGVTAHPTAEWITRQLTEAYGWKAAPQYVVRDRDAVYGDIFIRRLRAMGIRDRPTTAARSPWQNGYAERLIGSIRRNAWTTSSCLASGTFASSSRIKYITTRLARRFRAVLRPLAAFSACRSWADCTINTSGFDFR
jgi:hypothetical protein